MQRKKTFFKVFLDSPDTSLVPKTFIKGWFHKHNLPNISDFFWYKVTGDWQRPNRANADKHLSNSWMPKIAVVAQCWSIMVLWEWLFDNHAMMTFIFCPRLNRESTATYEYFSFIFYHGALSRIYVTVSDGYYKSGYNQEPIITQSVYVKPWTGPSLMHRLNPSNFFCWLSMW
jgi:hypothetical protein